MTEARLASGRGYTPDDFTPPPEAAPYEVTRTRATMMAQAEQQIAKISALDQQMAQKDAEADSTQAAIDKLEAGLPFLEETAEVREKAMNIEFGNRIAHLDAQLKLSEQRQNRSTIVREANMRWTYHQDLSDVPGWQDEDDNPIRFYVKN